jgi:hypothetical protein
MCLFFCDVLLSCLKQNSSILLEINITIVLDVVLLWNSDSCLDRRVYLLYQQRYTCNPFTEPMFLILFDTSCLTCVSGIYHCMLQFTEIVRIQYNNSFATTGVFFHSRLTCFE